MTYASQVLADNPEFYFRFEETSGVFHDSSPHNVSLTENGGTVTRSVAGAVADSLAITAGTSWGYLETSYDVPSSCVAQTLEAWVKTSTLGQVRLFNSRRTFGVGFFLDIGPTGFGSGSGQVSAYINATSLWLGKHSTATVNDGAWHHVVATWGTTSGAGISTSDILIYIDGALATTVNDSGNTGTQTSPLNGDIVAMLDLNGGSVSCDEFAFYTTKLSAARIAAHYDAADDAFTADFASSPTFGTVPLSVTFTDLSGGGGGTPNSWLWDFGDGTTSTSQNPSHTFTIDGTYTVTLTAGTTTAETDSVTHSIVAGSVYVPPEPSNAVIEIRAAAPGSARWGVAHWGEDTWAAATWQDVTPESVDAVVRWGSHSPDRGILTETEPASWLVNTYDPDRRLDPGNPDSPYAADLRAGLPIRIRHRGTIVRQGVCETIAFYHEDDRGGIRVTDNISLMARTPVPADSIVADTLYARARDVIAAAGLRVTVAPDPPSGDPALAPRLTGERSVWRHIADAAEQVLHIPYVDKIGTLMFRPWASPYDRGRGVDATQLVDLGTIVQTSGLYSVVRAFDGVDTIERRLTPTPRYGAVTYERSDETPDADTWAEAVLADRGLQSVQWIPGEIYPLTADDVEYFATLEAMERFGVENAYTTPGVDITGIIVGGEFRVRAKRASEAIWSFELELAQTADSPLYTDTDPPEFLRTEAGDGYLYPG